MAGNAPIVLIQVLHPVVHPALVAECALCPGTREMAQVVLSALHPT